MSDPAQTPFDSLENAHAYVQLLLETISESRRDVEADIEAAVKTNSERRVVALRLVHFKLEKLEQQLRGSSRLLNDLRTLRRLLLEERQTAVPSR